MWLAWLALLATPSPVAQGVSATATPAPRYPRLHAYLTRPVATSARYLDHGVIGLGIAGGVPHLYRLELAVGLLDHVRLGITAHWLPSESVPRWSPEVAVAFFRGERLEVGAWYFQSIYPPPRHDDDPQTPSFESNVHWLLVSATFSHRFVSGGFDVGVLRSRDIDPSQPVDDQGNNPSVERWHAAGGLHLRAGTRRWGFVAQGLAPRLFAELMFELRLGAFEARGKGGWAPQGHSWAGDRNPPKWR